MTRLRALRRIVNKQDATIHDFNRRYGIDFMAISNRDFFKILHNISLVQCITDETPSFFKGIAQLCVVYKMKERQIDELSFDKDSPSIKATCEALGISPTRKAIKKFINQP